MPPRKQNTPALENNPEITVRWCMNLVLKLLTFLLTIHVSFLS